MASKEKTISPQAFLKELRQIKLDIQPENLTPEGSRELLKQIEDIETQVLELKQRPSTPAEPGQPAASKELPSR